MKWNQILWGFTIQIVFGIFVLKTNYGKTLFACIGDKINTFLAFTNEGSKMVFGYLATGQLLGPSGGDYSVLIDSENHTLTLPNLPMPIQTAIFALSVRLLYKLITLFPFLNVNTLLTGNACCDIF